jgi:hypothetical protein
MATWNVRTMLTPSEMDGGCCNRLESNEDKAVDGEDKRSEAMETGC